jgi:two-component system sensor histidine kinase QseC
VHLPRSLRGRLLAGVLAVVVTVWGGAAALAWRDVRHELDELLDAHLAQAAALLVVQHSGELGHDDERTLAAPQLHRYAPRAVFQVFHEGQLVLRSADAPVAPLRPLREAAAGGFARVRVDGLDWRVFAARGAERDVQVLVAERDDARADIVRAALRGIFWPLALALPLLAVLAAWVVHRGLLPLRRLREQLAQRQPASTEPLRPLSLDGAPSEIAPLVATLDGLFARIAGLLDSERRFTADAAHELRTPIAAVRAQAQVALAETDDATRRHALQATLQGCDRATRLVEQLLTLSRLEAGAALPPAPVDLAALARRVLADLAPQALARGQALTLDADAAAVVPGDATLLAVLLRNLVDNALRHAPDGAPVAVRVAPAGGGRGATLQVDDGGPGLPDEQLAKLGERFWRGPQAAAGSGSGLGWSIVRRIAAVQGLALQVGRSAALGGLSVAVHWPAAPR